MIDIYEVLNKLNIEYQMVEHEEVFTAEQSKHIKNMIEGVGGKTLFLKDKNNYYLYLLDDERQANLKFLSKSLNIGRLSFGNEDELYDKFRSGEERVMIVSKVANFAVDLPDASVAIEISGSFGSRQEEAQRLGRILRPKARDSHFYTIVTEYSQEEDFASNRQKFLSEQGYSYSIVKEDVR